MPRKAKPKLKTQRRKPFIKQWRKHRGYTLAQFSERLELLEGFQLSDSQISRIERGEQQWTQDILEAMARVLQCAPADLIMRDPTGDFWSLLDSLNPTPQEVRVAADVIQLARKRTGTEG